MNLRFQDELWVKKGMKLLPNACEKVGARTSILKKKNNSAMA